MRPPPPSHVGADREGHRYREDERHEALCEDQPLGRGEAVLVGPEQRENGHHPHEGRDDRQTPLNLVLSTTPERNS